MTKIWLWLGTRAASGWLAAAGLALVGSMWLAYDHRGDKITELKLDLSRCQGSAKQAAAIKKLSDELSKQAQEKAQGEVDSIKDLPNDCYFLDDPSPLSRVRGAGSKSQNP